VEFLSQPVLVEDSRCERICNEHRTAYGVAEAHNIGKDLILACLKRQLSGQSQPWEEVVGRSGGEDLETEDGRKLVITTVLLARLIIDAGYEFRCTERIAKNGANAADETGQDIGCLVALKCFLDLYHTLALPVLRVLESGDLINDTFHHNILEFNMYV